jgi:hypothetical protein
MTRAGNAHGFGGAVAGFGGRGALMVIESSAS